MKLLRRQIGKNNLWDHPSVSMLSIRDAVLKGRVNNTSGMYGLHSYDSEEAGKLVKDSIALRIKVKKTICCRLISLYRSVRLARTSTYTKTKNLNKRKRIRK